MIEIILFLPLYIYSYCALVKYLNVGPSLGLINVRKKEYCLDAWILKVLQVGFEPPTLLFSFFSLQRSVHYITIYVFNFSIPLLICVFSYLWKEIIHEGKAVYGKHVEIFTCLLFCSIQS